MICLKNRTFAVSQTSETQRIAALDELWFAWKIVLLQYHKHHLFYFPYWFFSCDLLEKSYFCSITNIAVSGWPTAEVVVICLKNRTFAVSQTSQLPYGIGVALLWFAWKIVLLQYHKHRFIVHVNNPIRCDLLEKSYFCSITNIRPRQGIHDVAVVICLKNRTFAVSQTSVW